MDENYQDKAESKPVTQEELDQLQKKQKGQKKGIIKRIGLPEKNIWNWLQLLLIPLVLTVDIIWFGMQQSQTSLQIAQNQQQEVLLMTYIDAITDLIAHQNLLNAHPGDPVAVIAKARTLVTFQWLDIKHRGLLLTFLYQAGLINRKNVIINLSSADAAGTSLWDTSLNGAYLSGANLAFAYLSYAHLIQADLSGANLSQVNLSHANLTGADLNHANLTGADLSHANLTGAHLIQADLTDANLSGTIITQVQLAQAKSLQGTIMPDGSKHP